jgi:hypothetical protein
MGERVCPERGWAPAEATERWALLASRGLRRRGGGDELGVGTCEGDRRRAGGTEAGRTGGTDGGRTGGAWGTGGGRGGEEWSRIHLATSVTVECSTVPVRVM